MTDWTYEKRGGTLYPVKRGDTWRIGPHTVTCLDVLRSGEAAYPTGLDLVWADPPWDSGALNQFRTKANVHRSRQKMEWLQCYQHAALTARHNDTPIYMDGSTRHADLVQQHTLHSFPHRHVWPTTYFGGRPCVLHYGGPTPPPADHTDQPGGPALIARILASYEPGVVYDPFAGLGTCATEAARLGWTTVNYELHPNRCSATIHALATLTGHTPTREE